MTDVQRYCPRCARPAVRTDSATEEIWYCQFQHGVVYKAPLQVTNEQATEPEGGGEHEGDTGEGETDGEKEVAEEAPEPRARAPARLLLRRGAPAKKPTAPKKK